MFRRVSVATAERMGAGGFVGGKKTLLISSSSSAASLARGSSGARNRLSRRPCSPVQYHDNKYSHSVTKGRHGGRDSCCRNGRTRRLRCEASSSSNLSTRDRVLKGTALVRAGKLKEAVRELEPLIEGKKTEKKTEGRRRESCFFVMNSLPDLKF